MSGTGWWFLTLALGLVVAVVVVVLLQSFLRQVRRIEAAAGTVWQAGQEVAANTSHTWLLERIGSRVDALVDEAGRHRRLWGGDGTQEEDR
jgi:hypothetical protein